ncbi:MAG: hypothetical protein LLF76_08995 [Planctomycetaceae bacterium]|nr:hypothetical protein [Planctomycetaceae bacterium]
MRSLIAFCITCLCISNLWAVMVPISFERLTNNSDRDIAGQFLLNVSDDGMVYDEALQQWVDNVVFEFINQGPVASSISEIYFYDGSLLNMYSIDDSCPGVDFENLGQATNPAELPGYSPTHPVVVVISATEAETPESHNGVKPGQWLAIDYTLLPGKTIDDLLADLAAKETVIGIHLKSIEQVGGGDTKSDSFITIPEPLSLLILTGAALLGLRRRAK